MTILDASIDVVQPTSAEVVVARGIGLRRRGVATLREVSLTVHSGEAMLLVGPNGAGKSTLLRILAGLERPDAGLVQIRDGEVFAHPHRARRRIGYVSQDPRFDSELDVRESLTFAAQGTGLGEADGVVESMLQLFDLFELRNRRPEELSRGEIQRLAIAHALARDPEVLLVDEPSPQLDGPTQSALVEMFFELKAMGKTCVIATHSPWPFVDWADRLAHLVDGQLRVGAVDQFRSPGPGVRIVRIGVLAGVDAAVARVAPPATVIDVFRAASPLEVSTLRVELADDPALVAALVRKLATSGIAVVEVYQESPSLEGIE